MELVYLLVPLVKLTSLNDQFGWQSIIFSWDYYTWLSGIRFPRWPAWQPFLKSCYSHKPLMIFSWFLWHQHRTSSQGLLFRSHDLLLSDYVVVLTHKQFLWLVTNHQHDQWYSNAATKWLFRQLKFIRWLTCQLSWATCSLCEYRV